MRWPAGDLRGTAHVHSRARRSATTCKARARRVQRGCSSTGRTTDSTSLTCPQRLLLHLLIRSYKPGRSSITRARHRQRSACDFRVSTAAATQILAQNDKDIGGTADTNYITGLTGAKRGTSREQTCGTSVERRTERVGHFMQARGRDEGGNASLDAGDDGDASGTGWREKSEVHAQRGRRVGGTRGRTRRGVGFAVENRD